MSALVVGAVAPDLPVYLPVGASYATTHSWPGLPVVVFFGLVLVWLWFAVVRDALVDLTPVLRHRVPAHARLERRAWLLAPIAVAIGAATHVLWDSVTHDYGFVVHHLTFLSEEYGPLPLYRWAQHTSTVVGSIVVAAYGVARPAWPAPCAAISGRTPSRTVVVGGRGVGAHRRDGATGCRGCHRSDPGRERRPRDRLADHDTSRASRLTAWATFGPNITGSLWSAPLITTRSISEGAASATDSLSADGTMVSWSA